LTVTKARDNQLEIRKEEGREGRRWDGRDSGETSFSITRMYFAEMVRWFIFCTIGIKISFHQSWSQGNSKGVLTGESEEKRGETMLVKPEMTCLLSFI